MKPRNDCSLSGLALDALLCECIHEHAGGRVREVTVTCADDRIVVRGKADSYYGWQLAVAACQQSLSRRQDVSLDCRFDVASEPTAGLP